MNLLFPHQKRADSKQKSFLAIAYIDFFHTFLGCRMTSWAAGDTHSKIAHLCIEGPGSKNQPSNLWSYTHKIHSIWAQTWTASNQSASLEVTVTNNKIFFSFSHMFWPNLTDNIARHLFMCAVDTLHQLHYSCFLVFNDLNPTQEMRVNYYGCRLYSSGVEPQAQFTS